MHEIKIILPDCLAFQAQRADFEAELCQHWQGFTVTRGAGAWCDDGRVERETVNVYTVACDDVTYTGGVDTNRVLRGLAWRYGRSTGQQCVYTRNYEGEVELVQTAAAAIAA